MHLTSAQDFQNISSKLIRMLRAVAEPGNFCVFDEAEASPAWGTPWCGPPALQSFCMLLRFLVIFPQPRVRKRPGGSCCSRACWQQEPLLAPWGLKSCREGDSGCPPCSFASSCNPLAPQKTHQAHLNPSQRWLGGKGKPSSAPWAQEGRFPFRGVKLQIPPILTTAPSCSW